MRAPPVISSRTSEVADWVEWVAWQFENEYSLVDLMGEITRGGGLDSEEALDPKTKDEIEVKAHDAFAEIEYRQVAAGESYPFVTDGGRIEFRDSKEGSVYLFLLMLSSLGKDGAPACRNGAELFEEVCTFAAEDYLGGVGIKFGFPRRNLLPPGFLDALNAVCSTRMLGEGGPARRDHVSARGKDGRLDLIAWRHFPDRRPGKAILLGQCASGHRETSTKLLALNPVAFQDEYLERHWESKPLTAFFFPWSEPDAEVWRHRTSQAGILFDRCRISYHAARGMPDDLVYECRKWAVASGQSHAA